MTRQATSLAAGGHAITVAYNGDSNYGGRSTTLVQTVTQPTSTTIISTLNPSIFGQTVTFVAKVSSVGGGETVAFLDGGSQLGTGSTTQIGNGAQATFSTSSLSAGTHLMTARYAGDSSGNFSGSTSGTLIQTVKAIPTISVSSSLNPSTLGLAVTFTATVAPLNATGTITFVDGLNGPSVTVISSVSLNNGKATFSTSGLSVGVHSITARYSGDSNNGASDSTEFTETIRQASTAITLASNVNPSASGQMVTFTACGIPTSTSGTVAFLDGATTLATNNNLSGPCSSFGTNILSVGSHSMTARYSGDNNNGGSTSGILTQIVNAH